MLSTKIKVPVEKIRNLEGRAEILLEARSTARKPRARPKERAAKSPRVRDKGTRKSISRGWKGPQTCSTVRRRYLPSALIQAFKAD